MKTNRRDFIKISGAGLGTVALASTAVSWVDGAILNNAIPNAAFERTPTYCEVCFWKCAGW
ncbi:MAG: thiosulfate reductase/polysulfide reductase chain A [Cyclobacteriaceae bacterium]|jgi:thiosulfate reductase/polysulfide reductase chain A